MARGAGGAPFSAGKGLPRGSLAPVLSLLDSHSILSSRLAICKRRERKSLGSRPVASLNAMDGEAEKISRCSSCKEESWWEVAAFPEWMRFSQVDPLSVAPKGKVRVGIQSLEAGKPQHPQLRPAV